MDMEAAVRKLGGAWPGDQSATANLYRLHNRYTTGDCRAGTIYIGTRTEFEECAARLRNEPSFDDAPDWAVAKAQDSDGCWWWYSAVPSEGSIMFKSNEQVVLACKGEVIGDWKQTLRLRPEEKRMETIIIGPCKCGGYGQVYDEKTEAELGRCHDDLKTVLARQENKNDWHKRGEFPPVGTVCEVRRSESWYRTKIIGWDGDSIVIVTTTGWSPRPYERVTSRPEDFRPIQTERERLTEKALGMTRDTNSVTEAVCILRDANMLKMPEDK